MKKLALLLLLLAPQAGAQDTAKPAATLFYSEHCGACLRFKREVLPGLKEKYEDRIEWVELCTDQPDNLSRFWALVRELRGEDAKPLIPAMEVGGKLFIGGNELRTKLDAALQDALDNQQYGAGPRPAAAELKKEFSAFSASAIISSGLIDGINPCAFAVIVFFISFLAVYGYSKKEIAVVGSAYCLGVFAAYMVIGLGILK
ncbi:MAG TPA: hypothetical protein PLL10_09775, partial [Elusimicrobiales bacterium]|nr:hypothetical protein [Elusimicrobiales bacterium]